MLVNDGSPADNSAEVCDRLAASDPHICFVDLSRNFGEHNAVMAGLNYCTGEAAVIIDDDFQNPPEEIARLLDKLREGYDVVYSRDERKAHGLLRNLVGLVGEYLGRLFLKDAGNPQFVVRRIRNYRGNGEQRDPVNGGERVPRAGS